MEHRFEQEQIALPYPVSEVVEDTYRPPTLGVEVPIYAIPVPTDGIKATREYVHEHYALIDPEAPTHTEIVRHFPDSLRIHNEKIQERNTHLREHQRSVFDDNARFFEAGNDAGYVKLPTGTGKTVIFVELCQALIDNAPDGLQPRILVVTPTKDLVHQTVGQQGDKGFGGFAEGLHMSTYFSDSRTSKDFSVQDSVKASDICITTYKSFRLMFETDLEGDFKFSYLPKKGDHEGAQTPRIQYVTAEVDTHKVIDLFDLVIFDEGHHLLGKTSLGRLDQLRDRNVPAIAFSATPGELSNFMPEIHAMGMKEAIERNLLAPLISFGLETGATIGEDALNNNTGEYRDDVLTTYLGYHEARNEKIVLAAKTAIEAGLAPVISCLAGKDLFHPNYIAGKLNQTMIVDPVTGESRYARVVAIDSSTSTKDRKKLLQDYEDGKLDGLTFINILSEGWDSQRAKALINARPTRSKIFGQQRLGRILRQTPNGQAGIVIDMLDRIVGNKHIPAVNTSDLLQYESLILPSGAVTAADSLSTDNLQQLERLSKHIGDTLENEGLSLLPLSQDFSVAQRYTDYFRSEEPSSARGEFATTQKKPDSDISEQVIYATLARIQAKQLIPGLNESVIEKLEAIRKRGYTTEKKLVGYKQATYYNTNEIRSDIDTLPLVNPEKYAIGPDGQKWASSRAFNKLLKNHFSWSNEDEITVILHELQSEEPASVVSMLGRYVHQYHAGTGEPMHGIVELFPLELYKKIGRKLQASLQKK